MFILRLLKNFSTKNLFGAIVLSSAFLIAILVMASTIRAEACPPGTVDVGAEAGQKCEPTNQLRELAGCQDPAGGSCVTTTSSGGGQELLPGGCITLPLGLQIGLCPTTQGFSGYLQRMYGFLLAFVAIAAFGGITYGGLLYIFAAGSIGRVDEAKKWIWNALIGLLVTAISFILLSTINPGLVSNLTIDLCKYVPSACSGGTTSTPTPITPPPTTSTGAYCDNTTNLCPNGQTCSIPITGGFSGTCQPN